MGLGFLFFGLGVLGVFVPLLPATPFFLLTVWCFSKSSEKFSRWFKNTKFHRDYIESFRPGNPVLLRKKIEILVSILIALSFSFYFTENVYLRLLLVSVFVGNLLYFTFFVKTKKPEKRNKKR